MIDVIGGQRLVRVAPPSLPPHHSDPATRDFQSFILVEALFHRCHLDVQGLLHQQLLSSAMVHMVVSSQWIGWWYVCLRDYNLTMHPKVKRLKSIHYMLKLSLIKGQGDSLIVKPYTTNQCIMCLFIQCVHGTQG